MKKLYLLISIFLLMATGSTFANFDVAGLGNVRYNCSTGELSVDMVQSDGHSAGQHYWHIPQPGRVYIPKATYINNLGQPVGDADGVPDFLFWDEPTIASIAATTPNIICKNQFGNGDHNGPFTGCFSRRVGDDGLHQTTCATGEFRITSNGRSPARMVPLSWEIYECSGSYKGLDFSRYAEMSKYIQFEIPNCGPQQCIYESLSTIEIDRVGPSNYLGSTLVRYLGDYRHTEGWVRFQPHPGGCGPKITFPAENMQLGYGYPEIRGTSEKPGALVRVFEWTRLVCQGTVQSNKTWSCQPTQAFSPGLRTIQAEEIIGGQVSPRDTRKFTVQCGNNQILSNINGVDTCSDGVKVIHPALVAPDQIIQNACIGLRDVTFLPGTSSPQNAEKYNITIAKDGVQIHTSGWASFEQIGAFLAGNYWPYLDGISGGSYDITCEVQYPSIPHVYKASNTFTIDPVLGASCEDLEFDPEEISKDTTTSGTCKVRNTQWGQRSIVTQKKVNKNSCLNQLFAFGRTTTIAEDIQSTSCLAGWGSNNFITDVYPNYISGNLRTYNGLQSFSENGEYMNVCLAHALPSYVGFSAQEKLLFPYVGVTSSACGGNFLADTNGRAIVADNGSVPIYVGKSYCENIQASTNAYIDVPFPVTCNVNTAHGQPNQYQIRVNGAVIKTGTVPTGASSITESIILSAGTNDVECLFQGAENSDFVAAACKKTIIPTYKPSGNCLSGDTTLNATLCPADDSGIGSDVTEKLVHTCSTSRKCEYTCNEGYIPFNGVCTAKATYGDITVPSYIRPQEDYPLVMCQGDPDDRYFKYQISRFEGTTVVNVCPALATGNHPNCVCQSGYTYDSVTNSCVADIACPAGASGTYPNCSCPAGYTYDDTEKSCIEETSMCSGVPVTPTWYLDTLPPVPGTSPGGTSYCADPITIGNGWSVNISWSVQGSAGAGSGVHMWYTPCGSTEQPVEYLAYQINGSQNYNKTYTQAGTYKFCSAANTRQGASSPTGDISVISSGTIDSTENTDTTGGCATATPIGTKYTSPAISNGSNGGQLFCSDEIIIPEGCDGEIHASGFADGLAVGENGTGGGGAALWIYRKDIGADQYPDTPATLNSHYNTGGPRLTTNQILTWAGVYKICTAANKAHSANRADASGTLEVISLKNTINMNSCTEQEPIICAGKEISSAGSRETVPLAPISSPGGTLYCSNELTIGEGGEIHVNGYADGVAVGEAGTGGGGAGFYVYRKWCDENDFSQVDNAFSHYNTGGPRVTLNQTYTQPGTYKICGAANRVQNGGRSVYEWYIEVTKEGQSSPHTGGNLWVSCDIDLSDISPTCTSAVVTNEPGVIARTTCSYTGSQQQITVPDWNGTIRIKAWGAGGAGDAYSGTGGAGGYTDGELQVSPGETYAVVVGKGGIGGAVNAYGFGGQGNTRGTQNGDPFILPSTGLRGCNNVPLPQGNGGGLSGLFSGTGAISSTDQSRAIIVAGGGWGSGRGGLDSGLKNGNQTSINVNASMQGSNNIQTTGWRSIEPCNGGGGGGYFGGLNNLRGSYYHGYGGSGYSQTGGQILSSASGRTPPKADDIAYVSGVADGGPNQGDGGNGLVVIEWLSDASPSCPTGQIYDATTQNCVAIIHNTCPPDATGTYPNCVCGGQINTEPVSVDLSGISNTCTSTQIGNNKIKTVCNFTWSDQQIIAPNGAIEMKVKAWGAGGGKNGYNGWAGGFTWGTFPTHPNTQYSVMVGEDGFGYQTGRTSVYGFGWTSGSGGHLSIDSSWGGLSGIFTGTGTIWVSDKARALIIAGGWASGNGATVGNFWRAGNGNEIGNCGGRANMSGITQTGSASYAYSAGGGGYAWGDQTNRGKSGNGKSANGGCGFLANSSTSGDIQFTPAFNTIPPGTDDEDYVTWIGEGYGNGTPTWTGLVVIEWTLENVTGSTSNTGSNAVYIPETNSCGYTSIVVTDVIYTSPVYEMNETGYGFKIHTAGLPDIGEYAVSCLSAPTTNGVSATPFTPSPHIDDVGIINSIYGAPYIDRIDRYRDVDGNGSKELDDTDSIAAPIDTNGNLVGNPIGIDYICSAVDGAPILVGDDTSLFQSIYLWPESIPSPIFYGGSVLPPLTTYISNTQSVSAYKRGVHETACFVKSGLGYSTNARGMDEFCLSETGNCSPSTCVSSANVCCADNPADQPVFNDPVCNNDPYAPGCQMLACCRLTPDAPGCFGCAAGERYCPESAQCINPDAGETCPGDDTDGWPGGSCNANGICEVGESCNCSDCGGQQDTCEDGLRCRYDPTDHTNSICMGCREGTRWCESQNSCIPAGQPCNGGEVCNNDGVCSGVESCGCADCSNQQDHCADGLKCLYDADDPINSSCGGGCPVGTRWCSADNKCIPAGQTCNGGEVCNNDGICNADEGCGCGDCSAQNDHCAAGLTCAFDAVNPEQSSCQGGPRTLVSSEMRRELCSAEESRALLQCADDDCEYFEIGDEVFSADGINFYSTSDTAPFFEAFPEGPVVLGGAMSFGSVKLSGTGPLVPMFIKSPSGVISQRYIYWNTKDTIKPTSNGLKLHLSNGSQVSATNPKWSNLPVIASVDCEDDMNGQDTPFCGCDVDEESGFETQFIDGDDNRALYTKIISANEEVNITVRDTAGNVAGTYSADIDFIDLDAPRIEITDSNGVDIAEINRQNTSGIPLKIALFDELSGIQDYSIKIGDPSLVLNAIDFDTCDDALAPISASQIGTHGKSKIINGGTVSTGKAIFVCVQDAAGNITQKKFTFSGSRLIGYYQGPVLGFGYSGETGITSVEKYEERLVDRVQNQEVELNKNYIAQQSNLAICQENAIERNIDTLARGRLQPNTGNLVIDDLASNAFVSNINGTNAKNTDGIIYYSFDTTGANVDGNTGRVVELQGKSVTYTGWNDPTSGPYSEEKTFSMDSIEVDGYKTVIIEGGNLYIGADMYYADEDSMIVFIVKRGIPSIHGHRQGGNVYIDADVTNVNGLFFIDGAFMNVDKSNSGSLEVLSSYNDTDVEKLRRQLLIYGSLSSNNTRWGSLKTAASNSNWISHSLPDYLGAEGHCPLGTDAYNSKGGGFENCEIEDAAKYDLETFRTFNLTRSNGNYLLDATSTPLCAGVTCSCAGNGSAFTAVGGIGTSSVVPNYFNSTTYALSGKRKCFYEDNLGNDKFETTNQLYATYVKFDSRDDKFDFDVLGGTDCR